MKSHFIAKALGKANLIGTDIEYKSSAVSHPGAHILLCCAEQHVISQPGMGGNNRGKCFAFSQGETIIMMSKITQSLH